MPTHRNSSFSMELAQSYFAQLNPIANKIAQDIQETKLAYGRLWNKLKPNEQNDIVNETLMKPEISLQYLDKISYLSSPPRLSYTTLIDCSFGESYDSFTPIVTDHVKEEIPTKDINVVKSKFTNKNPVPSLRYCSGFDQRNLCTFSMQKVALKIIHDEALGDYRDEHSVPFSYKTTSQINLHIFSEKENNDVQSLLHPNGCNLFIQKDISDIYAKATASTYQQLREKLSSRIEKPYENSVVNDSKTNRCSDKENPNAMKECKPVFSCSNTYTDVLLPARSSNAVIPQVGRKTLNYELLESVPNSTTSSTAPLTYAMYAEAVFKSEENTNLVQVCSSSSTLAASSSSTIASDGNNDEKPTCENVNLLDNTYLRKGFDFLNNW